MTEDTKLCPFCAEEIKAAAIVCKHCGRELPGYEKALAKLRQDYGGDEPSQEVSLSENYKKVSAKISEVLGIIKDEDKRTEAMYEEIYSLIQDIPTNDMNEEFVSINHKLKIINHYDVPDPSAVSSMKLRIGVTDIFSEIKELHTQIGENLEELSKLDFLFPKFTETVFEGLKDAYGLVTFKYGFSLGRNYIGSQISSLPNSTWDFLSFISNKVSSKFSPLLSPSLFSSNEILLIQKELKRLFFIVFLKYFKIGFDRAQFFSVDDQIRKNEIRKIPDSIFPSLPINIKVNWDSAGNFKISIPGRKSYDDNFSKHVTAISVPLVILHQMLVLRPSYKILFQGMLSIIFGNLKHFPKPTTIDSSLKEVEIKLISDSSAIIPQIYPKFRAFIPNNTKESSMVEFLINYLIAAMSSVDKLLRLTILHSAIMAADSHIQNHNQYIMWLLGRAWWFNADPFEDVIQKRLESFTKK